MDQCRDIKVIHHIVEWNPKLDTSTNFEKSSCFTYNNNEFCFKISKRVIIKDTAYPSHRKSHVWEFKVCLKDGTELYFPFDVAVSIYSNSRKLYTTDKETFDDNLQFLSWILPESALAFQPDVKPAIFESNPDNWNINFDRHFHLQVIFSSCSSECLAVHIGE